MLNVFFETMMQYYVIVFIFKLFLNPNVMQEYTKAPPNTSRALDGKPKASRQAPMSEMLQACRNRVLAMQSVEHESAEVGGDGQEASVVQQGHQGIVQRRSSEVEDEIIQGKYPGGVMQRQIQISGSVGYVEKVLQHISSLLDGDWTAIKQGKGEGDVLQTLDVDDGYKEKIDDFIALGKTPGAQMIRRRIASKDAGDYADFGLQTVIKDINAASSTDGMSEVGWNSEEKMICYTQAGFQLNPPEILLAHEIGHVDGALSGETNGAYGAHGYDIPYFKIPPSPLFPDGGNVKENTEELRNTGIKVEKPGWKENPFSENAIRKSKGLPERMLYSKLVSWWIRDGKLVLDPPVNKDILKYYREVVGLEGVSAIVATEIAKEASLSGKKGNVCKAIMDYIATGGAAKEILISDIPDDVAPKPLEQPVAQESGESVQLKKETASGSQSGPVQFDGWSVGGQEVAVDGTFNKPIPVAADAALCARIGVLKTAVLTAKEGGESVLLYLAAGTANRAANGTNPSLGGTVDLGLQQHPPIIGDAEKQGYRTIVLNIDDFSGSESEEKFNGLFPMSGKTTDGKDAQSITALRELFEIVYSTGTGDKLGQVILVNAVEDTKPKKDGGTHDLDHSKFRGYPGFKALFPGKARMGQFTYATSYFQYPGFDLYKNIGNPKIGFLHKAGVGLSGLADLAL